MQWSCRGCSVSKVDALCFELGCSAHDGGCGQSDLFAVPPTVSLNVYAVPMQWMQSTKCWLLYFVMEDAVPWSWMQCAGSDCSAPSVQLQLDAVSCSGCNAPCIVLECGCSGHAVDAVSHTADAVCYVGGWSAHEGG